MVYPDTQQKKYCRQNQSMFKLAIVQCNTLMWPCNNRSDIDFYDALKIDCDSIALILGDNSNYSDEYLVITNGQLGYIFMEDLHVIEDNNQ